jgi:hypothetical protein
MRLIVEDLISKKQQSSLRGKFVGNTALSICLESVLDFLEGKEVVQASGLIEKVVDCFDSESFKLHKKFKVVKTVSSVDGKWPSAAGNGFFIDKRFLFDYIITMVEEDILKTYKEHNHAEEYYAATKDLTDLLRARITPDIENQYAIIVLGKIENRDAVFLD